MKYFIIAGEQSGDLHGSNLVRELLFSDKKAEVLCWGGDLMEAAGAKLLMHYKKTAFMGFTAVLKNLGAISKNLSLCQQQITDYKPDVVILIDYPGFNLRIARFAHNAGYKVFYYISPKFWAWNEGRVKRIKKYVDKVYIIFPFEVAFYKKYGIDVEYHGNPLVDEIERKKFIFGDKGAVKKSLGLSDKPVIAFLAGSRRHEVEYILPQMLKIVSHFPGYQFVLAGVKNLPEELYSKIIGNAPVVFLKDKTYETLYISEAALVASGTATLETALINIPQVVCYKGDFFSMLIGWFVIKVKYISLVNLIMDKEVVKELLQYLLNEKNILNELSSILPGGARRETMLTDYGVLRRKLGHEGASGRVAREIIKELNTPEN